MCKDSKVDIVSTLKAEISKLQRQLDLISNQYTQSERQLNTLFNLFSLIREISSTLELEEVYSNILDLLIVAVGSLRHSIILIDERTESLDIVASKFGDDKVKYEHSIANKGIYKEVIHTKQVYVSEDVSIKNDDDLIVCIPIKFKDKVIGLIAIHELLPQKKSFTNDDYQFFDIISSQAGTSIISAMSYEATKKEVKRHEEELSGLHDISTLVSGALNIYEVLTFILKIVKKLLHCNIITLMLYDEETDSLIIRDAIGIDTSLIGVFTLKNGEDISGTVFKAKKPVLIKDREREIRYKHLTDTKESQFYSESILSVPIFIKDKSIGTLTVSNRTDNKPFDVAEKELLTTIAAQAAIGLDNAYIYEKLEKELMDMYNLFITTNQLHSTLNLDEIYRIAEDILVNFIGASAFSIMLIDKKEQYLTMALSRGLFSQSQSMRDIKIPADGGVIGRCIKERQGFVVPPDESPPKIKLGDESFDLYACIPLKIGQTVFGIININKLLVQKNRFNKFDQELFNLMAQHTATAIISAQLYAKSEQRITTLYDITRLLITNYDLHQSLTTAINLIQAAIENISVAIFILNEEKNTVEPIAYLGFRKNELDLVQLHLDNYPDGISIPILISDRKIGYLVISHNAGNNSFMEREINMLNVVAVLIAQIIEHDKHFTISKNIAILLNKEKQQSKAIVKGVADGLLVTDIKNNIVLANPIMEKFFNFSEDRVIGSPFHSYITNKKFKSVIEKTFTKGSLTEEIDIMSNGTRISLATKTALVYDETEKPFGVVTIMHDVSREKEADRIKTEFLKKMQKLSITDGLTELYNRRYMEKRIEEELHRAKRFEKDLSCLMLDIDHFKPINDIYGHQIGDKILIKVASLLKKGLRAMDIVARYGGEEFIFILPETGSSGAFEVAERIRKLIEDSLFTCGNEQIRITVSIGIASYPDILIRSQDELIKYADNALYEAKDRGRNIVIIKKKESLNGYREAR